jgi:ABC-2 type transport system permease protein
MTSHALTIAGRLIRQLVRDRRTIALIVIVPLVVMSLIGLSFPDTGVLDQIAPALLATMALFFSFLLTGIRAKIPLAQTHQQTWGHLCTTW